MKPLFIFNYTQGMLEGSGDNYIPYVILFLGVLICYSLSRPLVRLSLTMQAGKLLNYIISSLIITIVILSLSWQFGFSVQAMIGLLKVAFQCLASFGLLLLFSHTIRCWKKKA